MHAVANRTKPDVLIVEIGGTVGDIESLPFMEAIRQIGNEQGRNNAIFVHVTLVPFIAAAGESKTKPTQHSVKELREIGIAPDIMLCRSDRPLSLDLRRKIALFCNVQENAVISVLDVKTIYEVPLAFHEQGLDSLILDDLHIRERFPDANLKRWRQLVSTIKEPTDGVVKIAIVGKYVELEDSYKSLREALTHAGVANNLRVKVDWLESENLVKDDYEVHLHDYDAILVPGGFGKLTVHPDVKALPGQAASPVRQSVPGALRFSVGASGTYLDLAAWMLDFSEKFGAQARIDSYEMRAQETEEGRKITIELTLLLMLGVEGEVK